MLLILLPATSSCTHEHEGRTRTHTQKLDKPAPATPAKRPQTTRAPWHSARCPQATDCADRQILTRPPASADVISSHNRVVSSRHAHAEAAILTNSAPLHSQAGGPALVWCGIPASREPEAVISATHRYSTREYRNFACASRDLPPCASTSSSTVTCTQKFATAWL